MKSSKIYIGLGVLFILFSYTVALDLNSVPQSEWIQMFNKRDLNDWVPKVKGYEAGVNHQNTWTVKDSNLVTDYEDYTGSFGGRFGHIAWEVRPFSYYLLRVEYQFFGTQYTGGPGYGKANSGIMYHSQSATSMELEQKFPNSMETQLLGEGNQFNAGTATLCTVNKRTVVIKGKRKGNCNGGAIKKDLTGLTWVKVEVLVMADSLVKHIVEGDTVMEYSWLQHPNGDSMTQGYIMLQTESAPIKFKTVEILNLEGCMDSTAKNYKNYYVKNQPDSCKFSTPISSKGALPSSLTFSQSPSGLTLTNSGKENYEVMVNNIKGKRVTSLSVKAGETTHVKLPRLGMYILNAKSSEKSYQKLWVKN